MDQEYDAVVVGTGLAECVLSGLLATKGKMKVLHVDRNKYYGGESASLTMNQLFEKFTGKEEYDEEKLGRNKDYCVDLIPKLLMAHGKLVKLLHLTGVTRYNMDFTKVEGSFVYKKGKVHKVPVTASEVAGSPLMGWMEKFRAKKLLTFINNYDENDQKTWKSYDLQTMTARDLFKKYGVSQDTIEFLGHAVALYSNDDYLDQPALATVKKMQLYANSLAMYGLSPYIYPMYGLGELPQVFARLCAVYGGTYMLNTQVDKFHYDSDGKVCGVESNGQVAKCKLVVGDPSYFPDMVKKTGKVIRVICILDHPIECTKGATSCQIIIPQNQANRQNDIYIACTSYNNRTCPKGRYIAIVSTAVETSNPSQEVQIGLDLLGPILQKFEYVLDTYEPLPDMDKKKVFISNSFDPSTHFESATQNIVEIFEKITGEPFDWTKKEKSGHEDEEGA